MAKINVAASIPAPRLETGGVARRINPEQQLRRLTASCMLWEDGFYVDGKTVAETIKELVPKCRPEFVAACADEARNRMHLRHVGLLLVREMARHDEHKKLVAKLLPSVIKRADELAEFMAIYQMEGRQPVSAAVKKGLAAAFQNFDEYQIAKYNRDATYSLKDVARIAHVKPWDGNTKDDPTHLKSRKYGKNADKTHNLQRHPNSLLGKLSDDALKAPGTWEQRLSAGEDAKTVFTELMEKRELGGLAYLRNLNNMDKAGIDRKVIAEYGQGANFSRVLPFRFLAAARMLPKFEDILEPLMLKSCVEREKLPGRTFVLVDVSGSMENKISQKSDLTRMDAGIGLAIILRELCEDVQIFTFSNMLVHIPPRRGFALGDAIKNSQPHMGTALGGSVRTVFAANDGQHDRLIILTDEQDTSGGPVPNPVAKRSYMINIASTRFGVGYHPWRHIDGWSESVVDYIREFEREDDPIVAAVPESTPKAA